VATHNPKKADAFVEFCTKQLAEDSYFYLQAGNPLAEGQSETYTCPKKLVATIDEDTDGTGVMMYFADNNQTSYSNLQMALKVL
jgi:hypothetical protein